MPSLCRWAKDYTLVVDGIVGMRNGASAKEGATKTMRLRLIRHGESVHNVEHFHAGKRGCKGLTPTGIQQAETLAKHLKSDPCDVLLSTSVKRAHQTVTIISQQLAQPIHINDDLCELLLGDADGMTSVEYREEFGKFDLIAEPDRPFSPNGETWNQFVGRVDNALDDLQRSYAGQNIIAVTHAGFMVVAFLRLFNASFGGNRGWIDFDHTSITEWHVSDDVWKLVRFNDTHHLT